MKSHIAKAAKLSHIKGKLQILGHFTTQLLYDYSLKSSSEDYSLESLILTCLTSSFVVP